ALARLPAEYRAIDSAPQVTRADLAALIGVRLGPVLQGLKASDAVLITDLRDSWAQDWIMMVARAGIMDPFVNHAFQRKAIVGRADLAQVISRLLARIATPAQLRAWQSARPRFSDLATTHLAYPAASLASAASVMTTAGDNSFQPSRPVTGAE